MDTDVDAAGRADEDCSVRLLEKSIYRGPNLYSHTRMIRLQLDIGALEQNSSNRLHGFNEALLNAMPGLFRHGCSYGTPGGFVRRLEDGTWLGHIVEHVAIEFQCLAGSVVTRGKTRSVKGRAGVYNVLYEYRIEEAGLLAGRMALELVVSLLPAEFRSLRGLNILPNDDGRINESGYDVASAVTRLGKVVRGKGFGPTTGSIVAEAERRFIAIQRLDNQGFVQLGHGKNQKRIRASMTAHTSHLAAVAAGDKNLTKALLANTGLPVPRGFVVATAEEALIAAAKLDSQVVIKPLDGNHGRGVGIGLTTPKQIKSAFDNARRHSSRVMVEELYPGNDHRILVIDGRIAAVAQRVPAHVVGNGHDTISVLIEDVNKDPRRGEGHEGMLTRIGAGEAAIEFLSRAQLTLESIPAMGEIVYLALTANLSTGGTAIDRTDDIHPENAAIARRAALAVGLDIAGIDFMAPDIARSVRETGGGIIEVNAAPGFRMHLSPSEGQPRNVARPVLDMLFPKPQDSRIPIFAITGTNGKSTTCRMVAHILKEAGHIVGLTSTTGVYIDGHVVKECDASGPQSARLVLGDPTVTAAVFETARGGILREGLAFEAADVGAVLNIQADHLGLKGVETLQDLAHVKRIVVRAVRRGGCSVLNADDPLTAALARKARGKIMFFSLHGGDDMPDFLREHIAKGHLAVVREPDADGGRIVIHEDCVRLPLMKVRDIPATIDGMAEFNVQNAMAAIGMCFGQGIALSTIQGAMSSFTSSFEQNPGRLNVHDGNGFRVILDYAHNPAGMSQLAKVINGLRPNYRRVIGMISIPGDRRDSDILEMGNIVAGMLDEAIFWEEKDRRGRKDGGVTELLVQGAMAKNMAAINMRSILSERAAAEAALQMARPGDLVLLTCNKPKVVWQCVLDYKTGAGSLPQSAFNMEKE